MKGDRRGEGKGGADLNESFSSICLYLGLGKSCLFAYFIKYSFWLTMLLLSPSRPSSCVGRILRTFKIKRNVEVHPCIQKSRIPINQCLKSMNNT